MLLANGHYIITTVMTGTELLVKDSIQTYFGIIKTGMHQDTMNLLK